MRPLRSSTNGTHPMRPMTVSLPGSVRTSKFKGSTKYPRSARAVESRFHLHAPLPNTSTSSASAMKLGKQLAKITAPTIASLTPCVTLYPNCSTKLFPVVTSTTNPVSTPNIATRAFTNSGNTPSHPNTNKESTLSALSNAPLLSSRSRRRASANFASLAARVSGFSALFFASMASNLDASSGAGTRTTLARSNTRASTSSNAAVDDDDGDGAATVSPSSSSSSPSAP
mmetsp:Transcript_7111/g.26010  ORF Transcript_7111/g.26010 Transcript_7111/m.26010 type:complete len:228 (+) Transcript_7111:1540-2223(+)